MIKVSKMVSNKTHMGTCMVFYDMTDLATQPDDLSSEGEFKKERLQLFKLPVYQNNQVLLIDLDMVCAIKADGHYSTLYSENEEYLCNLSLSDLEWRIQSKYFLRVHRSHIVNFRHAKGFEKEDEHHYLIVDYQDGMKIPISKTKVTQTKHFLGLS